MSLGMPTNYSSSPATYNAGYGNYGAPAGQTRQPGQNSDIQRIKMELGGGILNASRTPLEGRQLYGLQDGEPINPRHGGLIPTTGVSWVDASVSKGEDVVTFTPQALGNSAAASLRGSVVGGLGTGFVAAIGSGLAKLLIKESQFSVGAWTAGLSVLGAMMGGGVGFAKSMYENCLDLKRLLFGVTFKG